MASQQNAPNGVIVRAERWQQIKAVLSAALDVDPAERASYLDQACAGDSTLRQEIENLLAYEDDPGVALLDSPAIALAPQAESGSAKTARRRVGPYEIVEEIGSGGMGEVYRAIRADDQYRKEVAIKLVRRGLDIKFVIDRFRSERQLLAGLDHPNIARLLDGGTTEDGIPYFAMDLIEGRPVHEYCDDSRLRTAERLKIFLQVCSAVQYAHQRLIVHRDLKPSNILVTADGTPKLLDFGIAKIMDSTGTSESAEETGSLFRLLTPAYASPEQVKGEPVTTASDVYSLGVLLYESLTGHRPYRAHSEAPHELARLICEFEPERPSAIIWRTEERDPTEEESGPTPDTVSQVRDGTPDKLSRRLRGDLDNIVLTALRKEPQRRYQSVEQLAGDIRRHLGHLPVSATRDTLRYRMAKFIARHKSGVAAGVAMLMLVFAGALATLYQAHRARQNELRAERRFNDVRKLAKSLLFEVHDSIKNLPGSTPARKLIVERALEYLDNLSKESAGDLSLQRELAEAYDRVGLVQGQYLQNSLGDTRGALASYQKAFAIRKSVDDRSGDVADRLALAQAYRLVANSQWALGDFEPASRNIVSAIEISEALDTSRPNQWEILFELSADYEYAADIYEPGYGGGIDQNAVQAYRKKAIQADEAMLRMRPQDAGAQDGYAIDLIHYGQIKERYDPREALGYYERALAIHKSLMSQTTDPRIASGVARDYQSIADVYESLGDFRRAYENNLPALEIAKRNLETDPRNVTFEKSAAIAYLNAATQARKIGHKAEAFADTRAGLEWMRTSLAADPNNQQMKGLMAVAAITGAFNLLEIGQPAEAMTELNEGCAIYQAFYQARPDSPGALLKVALCNAKKGDAARIGGATQKAREYYELALRESQSAHHPEVDDKALWFAAANAYAGFGDLALISFGSGCAEAARWYRKSLDAWRHTGYPQEKDPYDFEMGDPGAVSRKLDQCGGPAR
jgi:tetratricopeptide (TPR) repeat protein/tRNA A-37 threonylcarbamoyl transferase component Bud32